MTQEEVTKWLIENWPSIPSALLKWLIENWPSIPSALLLSGVYLKLRGFANRLLRLEKRTSRIMDVCSAQHPDKGRDLFKDDETPE